MLLLPHLGQIVNSSAFIQTTLFGPIKELEYLNLSSFLLQVAPAIQRINKFMQCNKLLLQLKGERGFGW